MVARNQDTINEETGIHSSETEEDMKEYLEQVIEEVKNERRKPWKITGSFTLLELKFLLRKLTLFT